MEHNGICGSALKETGLVGEALCKHNTNKNVQIGGKAKVIVCERQTITGNWSNSEQRK